MRLKLPGRPWAHAAVVATAVLALVQVGAGPGKKKKKKEPPPPTVQETVGDLSFVVSRGEWKVEGVGLVWGLDNTGADAPQSWYRKQLVDEMSKAGVEHAEKLLAKPQCLDGDRAADDSDRRQHDGPAGRPGRGSAGVRNDQPGRRLS